MKTVLHVKKIINDTNYRELLVKSGSAFVLRILGVSLSFLFTLIVARNLGPEGLGVYSIVIAVLFPLSVLSRLGLDNLMVKIIPIVNVKYNLVVKKYIFKVASLVVFIVAILLSILIILMTNLKFFWSRLLGDIDIYILWIIAIILPFHSLMFLNIQSFKGEKLISLAAFLENVFVWFMAIIVFIFLCGQKRVIYLSVASYAIAVFISFLVAEFLWFKWLKKANNQIKAQRIDLKLFSISKLLKESLPMYTTSIITILMTSIDVLLLSYFYDKKEVGIYSAAVKIVTFVSFPLAAVINIAGPKFSEAYAQGSLDLVKDTFFKSTRITVLTALPIILCVGFMANIILGLYGREFIWATSVVYILLLGQFINVIVGPIGYLLWMTEGAAVLQNIMILSLLLNVFLNIILIPVLGISGAAIAGAFSIALKNILCWFAVRNRLGFSALYLPGGNFIYAVFRTRAQTKNN